MSFTAYQCTFLFFARLWLLLVKNENVMMITTFVHLYNIHRQTLRCYKGSTILRFFCKKTHDLWFVYYKSVQVF